MTQARLVADLTDDVVLVAFFGALFFIITYSLTSRWWRHAIGTTLVILDLGLVLTLAPSVLHRFFGLTIGMSAFFDIYFLCSLCLVGVGVWWRALVMLRINWQGRRMQRGERKPLSARMLQQVQVALPQRRAPDTGTASLQNSHRTPVSRTAADAAGVAHDRPVPSSRWRRAAPRSPSARWSSASSGVAVLTPHEHSRAPSATRWQTASRFMRATSARVRVLTYTVPPDRDSGAVRR